MAAVVGASALVWLSQHWLPAQGPLRMVVLTGAEGLACALLLWRASRVLPHLRGAGPARGTPWRRALDAVAEVLPGWSAALVVSEVRIMWAFLRALANRPLSCPPELAFTATRTSSQGQLVAALICLTVSEMLIAHLLVRYWVAAGGTRLSVHLLLGIGHLYWLGWLIGDRRLIRESAHEMEAEGLRITLGQRWTGWVPYGAIEAAMGVADMAGPVRRDRRGLSVTPLERPNVMLRLKEPVTLHFLGGIERRATRIYLYVDEPVRFLETLRGLCPPLHQIGPGSWHARV